MELRPYRGLLPASRVLTAGAASSMPQVTAQQGFALTDRMLHAGLDPYKLYPVS